MTLNNQPTPVPAPRPRPNPRPGAGVSTPTSVAAQIRTPAALERLRRQAAAIAAGTTERATYEDEDGRKWAVLVPLGRTQDAAQGVVIGPPDLREVGGLAHLPENVLLALHNELFNRGLLTERDLVGRGPELQAAFMAVLRADLTALRDAYRSAGGAD